MTLPYPFEVILRPDFLSYMCKISVCPDTLTMCVLDQYSVERYVVVDSWIYVASNDEITCCLSDFMMKQKSGSL